MRQNVSPEANVSLRTYFNRLQSNFTELYRKIDSSETGYTGVQADVITSGTINDDRISSNIARRQEILGLIDQINTSIGQINTQINNMSPILNGTEEYPTQEDLPDGTVYIRYE